jgi:hypothetical protein
MDLLPQHAPTFSVDIDNRVADHTALTLEFSKVPGNYHLRKSLLPDPVAYDQFIAEATNILMSANAKELDKTADRITDSFERHSVVVQSKPLLDGGTMCGQMLIVLGKFSFRLMQIRSELNLDRWFWFWFENSQQKLNGLVSGFCIRQMLQTISNSVQTNFCQHFKTQLKL